MRIMYKYLFIAAMIFVTFSWISCGRTEQVKEDYINLQDLYDKAEFNKIQQHIVQKPYSSLSDSMKIEYLNFLNNMAEVYETAYSSSIHLTIDGSKKYLEEYGSSVFSSYVWYNLVQAYILAGDYGLAERELDTVEKWKFDSRDINDRLLKQKNALKNKSYDQLLEDSSINNMEDISLLHTKGKELIYKLDQLIINDINDPFSFIINNKLLTLNTPIFIVENISKFYDLRLLKITAELYAKSVLYYSSNYPLNNNESIMFFKEQMLNLDASLIVNDQKVARLSIATLDKYLQGKNEKLRNLLNELLIEDTNTDMIIDLPEYNQAWFWNMHFRFYGKSQGGDNFFVKQLEDHIDISVLDWEKEYMECEEFSLAYQWQIYFNRINDGKVSMDVSKYLRNRLEGFAVEDLSGISCVDFNPWVFISESAYGLRNVAPAKTLIFTTISALSKEVSAFRILYESFSYFVSPADVKGKTTINT